MRRWRHCPKQQGTECLSAPQMFLTLLPPLLARKMGPIHQAHHQISSQTEYLGSQQRQWCPIGDRWWTAEKGELLSNSMQMDLLTDLLFDNYTIFELLTAPPLIAKFVAANSESRSPSVTAPLKSGSQTTSCPLSWLQAREVRNQPTVLKINWGGKMLVSRY